MGDINEIFLNGRRNRPRGDLAAMTNVDYEFDGPVAIITINRPQARNAVNDATAVALVDAFRRFDADDSLSVAVLTGRENCFCAGYDLHSFATSEVTHHGADHDGPMGPSRLLLSKPTIAAVEGYAVAGGLELAIWCDLRVAATDAIFGVFCRRWGVPLIDGGTVRLPRLIGHSNALDLILTGRPVSGEEAVRMGLVNRLVPTGTALDAAIGLAKEIAAFPQQCLRGDRMSSYTQWDLELGEALNAEARRGIEVIQAGESRAGAERFAGGAGRHGSYR